MMRIVMYQVNELMDLIEKLLPKEKGSYFFAGHNLRK
jgi:hypothetical protein